MTEKPTFKDFKKECLKDPEVREEYLLIKIDELEKENKKLKEYQQILSQNYAQLLAEKMARSIQTKQEERND